MEEFTKELLDQLNVDTAFTIGPFAISESVVITWVVMAILVLLSAWLTRGLKVHNPGKKQIVADANKKSDEMIEQARTKTIEAANEEKAKAKSEIADLINKAADKITNTKSDEKLYDDFLKEMK